MDIAFGLSPFMPGADIEALRERAYRLAVSSARLCGIPPQTAKALADMLSIINSYYSNLIEGQGTHPVEVDRAVRERLEGDDLDGRIHLALVVADTEKRLAQLLQETGGMVSSTGFICRIHQSIYDQLPHEMRRVHNKENRHVATLVPGQFRDQLVEVGRHVPVDVDSLGEVLRIFQREYDPGRFKGEARLIAAAAAHHRLAWIHPFLDGNGRVARLFTHAYMEQALGHQPIWSISRGLARSRSDYYRHLAEADQPRRGDFDGRGARSDAGLASFCTWFLDICQDQVDFMASCLDLGGYRKRVEGFVQRAATGGLPDTPRLDPSVASILTMLMAQGEISRGEAARMTGFKERKASLIIRDLINSGLAISSSHVAPLRPAFPARYLDDLFPRLGPLAEPP